MNEFTIDGKVTSIESEKTHSGKDVNIINIENDYGKVIPLRIYENCPSTGEYIRVSGRIVSKCGMATTHVTNTIIRGKDNSDPRNVNKVILEGEVTEQKQYGESYQIKIVDFMKRTVNATTYKRLPLGVYVRIEGTIKNSKSGHLVFRADQAIIIERPQSGKRIDECKSDFVESAKIIKSIITESGKMGVRFSDLWLRCQENGISHRTLKMAQVALDVYIRESFRDDGARDDYWIIPEGGA